ncbi:MAG: exosortase T [Candidatus Competibacteraceae bacterium]
MRYTTIYPLLGPTTLVLGLVVLAVHPLVWLVGTWLDPAYDSYGLLVVALTLALLLWSATSSVQTPNPRQRRSGLRLLALTAAIRLLGQWLGVNTLGAAALAVDVYAIGLLLELERRARPLSSGWLAVLFTFALPIERILQRCFGFALQQISAVGACTALSLGAPVQCEGIQLQWQGQTVLVDLPCSGARGLLLLLLLFVALATIIRPDFRHALLGFLLALTAAALGNSLRIVAIAFGLVHREALGGIDVLAEPWHDVLGLVTLSVAALPLLLWAHYCRPRQTIRRAPAHCEPFTLAAKPLTGLTFLLSCGVIVALPSQPLDVARSLSAPQLPTGIATFAAQPGVLSVKEQSYFTRYGGGAARATYGPYGLLVVRTSAPLRHLHSPEECLAGEGHEVRYLGQTVGPIPSALYRTTDPQGRVWRVAVSYVSARGEFTTHVAHAVWLWLQTPGTTWSMIERITPWELSADAVENFDVTVWRALDLSPLMGRVAPQNLL